MDHFFLGFSDELEKLAVMTPMKKLLLAAATVAGAGAVHLYRNKSPRTARGGDHVPTRTHGLLSGKPKEPKSETLKQMMTERWHQWKKDEKASAAIKRKAFRSAIGSPLFSKEVGTGRYKYKTKAPVTKPKG